MMMDKPLRRLTPTLFYWDNGKIVPGPNPAMRGNCSRLWGDCSGLWGDCSWLWGDCTGLSGDCTRLLGDLTDIPASARPADIADFVEATQAQDVAP